MGAESVRRVSDWDVRLNAVMGSMPNRFEWGVHDCGRLVLSAVEAVCGESHPLMKYSDKYADERGAKILLKEGGGLDGILSEHLEEVHWMRAQRGDVGYMGSGLTASGVVMLDNECAGVSEEGGLYRVHPRDVTKLFRLE